MSDNNPDVLITPVAGGYYDLTHPSLTDPERVQGKEKADTRASEIKAAAEPAEGKMESNPDLNQLTTDGKVEGSTDTRSAAEKGQENAAIDRGLMPQDPIRAAAPTEQERDAEVAALRAALADQTARTDELEQAAAKLVRTVNVEAAPDQPAIPAHVPKEYRGQMDEKQKAALADIGVGFATIVLEENDSIPPTGLFIGHNGRGYMIKPGEEVDVPDFLLAVLDDAVMSAPVTDSQTQKVLGYRNRSKYPYRRINN